MYLLIDTDNPQILFVAFGFMSNRFQMVSSRRKDGRPAGKNQRSGAK